MQNIYTDSSLILYIYEELNAETKRCIDQDLQIDSQLKDRYDIIKNTIDLLPTEVENPHPTTIELILEYSKSKSSMKTASQF